MPKNSGKNPSCRKYGQVREEMERILREKGKCIVVIDGDAAAGKSTLASFLQQEGYPVVAVDDFYYPNTRIRTPGEGNSDLARIVQDVILPFMRDGRADYRVFSPMLQDLGEEKSVSGPVLVIEGTYSMHPLLQPYTDLSVFMKTDEKTQLERIQKRDPHLVEAFTGLWIPQSRNYFDKYQPEKRADIIIGE